MKFQKALKIIGKTTLLTVIALYILLAPCVATPLYNHLLFYPNWPVRYESQRYQPTELQGVTNKTLIVTLLVLGLSAGKP
jgi:hypothetical protein